MGSVIRKIIGGVEHVVYNGRAMPIIAGGEKIATREEVEARQTEIRSRISELNDQYRHQAFPNEVREEWTALNEELDGNVELLRELDTRERRIAELDDADGDSAERGIDLPGATPRGRRGGSAGDPFDLSTVRASIANPDEAIAEMRDRARRVVERATFPHEHAGHEDNQGHLERLIQSDESGEVARHILVTGSPVYERAFARRLANQNAPLTDQEQRALALGTQGGNLAVPFTLDPTLLLTSNGQVNPLRQVSRVVQIAGSNEWRGLKSTVPAATRVGELVEATDDSPTVTQPTATVTKAHVFIPFSMEVDEDWPGMRTELAALIQESKDAEEATSFMIGSGAGVNPQGVITGATTTVNAAGGQAYTLANLYALLEALPPRYQPNATFLANLAILNKTRQFDTSGGAAIWVPSIKEGVASELLGRPAYQASTMAATSATGNKFLLYGDFRRFLIVDRIGLSIELVPHLFGENGLPLGERGFYAHWRNTSKVLDANAFRVLLGVA